MIKLAILAMSATVLGSSCPGASMPALSSAEQAVMQRAKTLGRVPTDSDISTAANAQRVKRLLPESQFNYLFPRANEDKGPGNGPYSYYNFIKAVTMWPAFCNESGNGEDVDTVCKREMASMFAMWGQEVGGNDPSSQYPQWRQALYAYEEEGCNASPSACNYCSPSADYPCVSGQSYYGRGSYQLSWNYNYGPFSFAMFGDASILLKNPGLLIATDTVNGWLSFASALWFHMTPQSPNPSMHDVVSNFWVPNSADIAAKRLSGFGAMTMIINGAIECSKSSETDQSKNRVLNYIGLCGYFGIAAGSNTACASMKQFDDSSSGSMPEYWDQGSSCACQLVSYGTPYSIFDSSSPALSYQRCLNKFFPGQTTKAPVTTKGTTAAPTTAATTKASTTTTTAAPTTKATTSSAATTKATTAPATTNPTTGATTKPTTAPITTQQTTTPATTNPTTGATTEPTTAPVTTQQTTAGTTKVVTTTKSPTTASSTKSGGSVCNFQDCVECSAVRTSHRDITDDECSTCLWTNGPVYCAQSGSCVCSARVSDYDKCDSDCKSCKAIPGNRQSAPDAACSPCKGPNPQAWWPCNQPGLCQCA